MPAPITILVRAPIGAGQLERIAQAAPDARVVTADEAKTNPTLWSEADVVFTHHLKPERLHEAKKLRWIQTMGAGVEWLLAPEVIARKELTITNASGVHAEPIAEHVFGLILALARRLPTVLALQRESHWEPAKFQSVPTLAGATLGILGLGAIGRHIAAIGAAFHMRVIGMRRGTTPVSNVERLYSPEQLPELLGEAHYVINALPLTPTTRRLIGPEQFAAMRGDAIFINIGRGGTVQTDALVTALREKRIGGAGLDVTDPEPLPSDHPLWSLDNVLITPHYSGGRPGYAARVTDIFLRNLAKYRAGEPLENVVDAHAGY
jgi:phosphoglycerate dehydrogenase-like enzyme